jgi:quinol-cytochrome oxidoreductase complex cytochrome b subunit
MYLRYYVGYYGKRAVKPLAFLALTAGIVMGIWAIATKTHLSSDEKASVGFGFAAALPILLLVWLPLLARKRSETSRLRKCFLLLCLGVVLGLVAVAIWGIFAQNNSFSHGKRVSLSVFLAVFVPCVFSLVVLALNPDIGDDHITYFVLCLLDVLIVAYAAIIWAIATKSHLSHSGKVGVSILVSMVPISGIFSVIVSS